jgi:hypothetical protein
MMASALDVTGHGRIVVIGLRGLLRPYLRGVPGLTNLGHRIAGALRQNGAS